MTTTRQSVSAVYLTPDRFWAWPDHSSWGWNPI